MLHIKQSLPGVYELSIVGSEINNTTKTTRILEVSNLLKKDVLGELKRNVDLLKSLKLDNKKVNINDFDITNCSDGKIMMKHKVLPANTLEEITSSLVELDEKIRPILEAHPLLLLNECDSFYCPLTRSRNPIVRNLIELMLLERVEKADSICFVGVGGMFQELVILDNKNPCTMDVFIIDRLRDYIDTIVEDVNSKEFTVDPLKYYGKLDDQGISRAKWSYIKTLRYVSFLQYFASLGYNLRVTLCGSSEVYKNAMISCNTRPSLVVGIDLIDDFAEDQLTSFYTAALYSKVKDDDAVCGVMASNGAIHIFDVANKFTSDETSDSKYNRNDFKLLNERVEHDTKEILKYEGKVDAWYVLSLAKGTYKLDNEKRKKKFRNILLITGSVLVGGIAVVSGLVYKWLSK